MNQPTKAPLSRRRKLLIVICIVLVAAPVIGLVVLGFLSASPPDSLGVEHGKLAACPNSPNCVHSQVDDDRHHIAPIAYTSSDQQAMERMKRTIGAMPRTRIVKQTPQYLHLTAKSRIFRFTDDIELLLDSEAKVFHVRSASRVGYWDLGVNRSRVERLRENFESME